ncbi:hypothetical protein BLNAU_13423 [Blattamonas nauphoetae]|uniref:Uncharacterized protein n=1 Tax=Blattamonas nauphoetae TaxID=2049346 RepID=A0ABQ9XLI4_9EUKA|nr:hypothetical protein BLNAU_22883 [Blattamonas nauphoetae]KAK2951684.1 hypothetical protein BLNAU_13423 [Blattamonas nauphoetae]
MLGWLKHTKTVDSSLIGPDSFRAVMMLWLRNARDEKEDAVCVGVDEGRVRVFVFTRSYIVLLFDDSVLSCVSAMYAGSVPNCGDGRFFLAPPSHPLLRHSQHSPRLSFRPSSRPADTALPHPARHTTVAFPIRVAAAVCVQPVSSEGVRSRRRQNGEFSATRHSTRRRARRHAEREERECEGDSGRSVRASAESDRNRA